jgi:hypothetical protein
MRPKPSAAEIAERMEEIGQWMEYSIQHWLIHMDATRRSGRVNRFEVTDYSGFTGSSWPQVYLETLFEIGDDEALVIETGIPEQVRYWSFLLADELFATIDWSNHQSSLNGHQARLDADGKFRGVLSLRDPGVPNWLDTGGYHRGVIQNRWNQASTAPCPTITRTKLADVRDLLPRETPVVSPAERDAALRRRRAGAQMRRKW